METMNMSFSHMEFSGRNGLSRSLKARFTEAHFLYTFVVLATILGFFTSMNVFMPLLSGHIKSTLSLSNLFQLLSFSITAYVAWVLAKTSGLHIHLHGERLIYEMEGKDGLAISFADIQNIRFQHRHGVQGFFIVLNSGESLHFPIHLERLDYILDTLRFHRPDLTQGLEFFKFRSKALALDHMLAHNKSYLARAHVKAFLFYFMYPLFLVHSYKRLQSDPRIVSRDMEYEKKLETLCHRMSLALGLLATASVVFYKWLL